MKLFLKKVLTIRGSGGNINNVAGRPARKYADVAELADALDSGSSGGNSIWVQVPSSAPTKNPVKFRLCGVFAIHSQIGTAPVKPFVLPSFYPRSTLPLILREVNHLCVCRWLCRRFFFFFFYRFCFQQCTQTVRHRLFCLIGNMGVYIHRSVNITMPQPFRNALHIVSAG